MFINSISNTKLHCCLIILILFILIFLSLPLLLLWINEYYQAIIERSGGGSRLITTATTFPTKDAAGFSKAKTDISINCTEFAIQGNLSLVPTGVQCPAGSFSCGVCPEICILQGRNCNGVPDCPDKSDEDSSICNDSNGALEAMYRKINPNQLDSQNLSKSTNISYGLPKSCTEDDMLIQNCKCNLSETEVIVCENYHLDSVPTMILDSVYKIFLNNNIISDIDDVKWPKALTSLNLEKNKLTRIAGRTFKSTKNLSKLYLNSNKISHIDPEAFKNLHNLTNLLIESNKLETFHTNMIENSHKLKYLNLGNNLIELPDDIKFGETFPLLEDIALDFNRISIIRKNFFSNMSSLNWLSLTNNLIYHIEDGSFDLNYKLEELNLSSNKLIFINRLTFAKELSITRLFLGSNPDLKRLPIDAFRELTKLESLNLSSIEFNHLNRATFSYLTKLEFIYFAKFRYCHYAPHVRVCKPATDGLSSSKELLAFPILKYAVWIVALVCLIGNIFVFVWRSVSSHEDRILSLFVRNLSIADLMMGIYLATIAWQNLKFEQQFGLYAIEWMSSWTCTGIGFLAILSSELSVFILTIITIERYRSIVSINRREQEEQKRRARLYVILAWLFSFLIAFYPLIEWLLRESDYYATNDLCLPLHIDQPFTRGWEYSAFIYLGINFLAVIIIFTLYLHMYTMIIDGRQATRPALLFRNEEKREDAILAIRFFFIVVTDCLCWIPIVVIKVLALSNVPISSSIYGWLVVFIIPINSALNPIVYTLAAPTLLRDAVCRIIEQICYKIDSLTIHETRYSSASAHSSSLGSNLMPTTGDSNQAKNNKRFFPKSRGSNSTTTCDTFDTSIISGGSGNENGNGNGMLLSLPVSNGQSEIESTFVLNRQLNSTNGRKSFENSYKQLTSINISCTDELQPSACLLNAPTSRISASNSNSNSASNSNLNSTKRGLTKLFKSCRNLLNFLPSSKCNCEPRRRKDCRCFGGETKQNHVRPDGGGENESAHNNQDLEFVGANEQKEAAESRKQNISNNNNNNNNNNNHVLNNGDNNNRVVVVVVGKRRRRWTVDRSGGERVGDHADYLSAELQSEHSSDKDNNNKLKLALLNANQTTTTTTTTLIRRREGAEHCFDNNLRNNVSDNNNNNNGNPNDDNKTSDYNYLEELIKISNDMDRVKNTSDSLIGPLGSQGGQLNIIDKKVEDNNSSRVLVEERQSNQHRGPPYEDQSLGGNCASFSELVFINRDSPRSYENDKNDENDKNKDENKIEGNDNWQQRRHKNKDEDEDENFVDFGHVICKEQLNIRRFTNPTFVGSMMEHDKSGFVCCPDNSNKSEQSGQRSRLFIEQSEALFALNNKRLLVRDKRDSRRFTMDNSTCKIMTLDNNNHDDNDYRDEVRDKDESCFINGERTKKATAYVYMKDGIIMTGSSALPASGQARRARESGCSMDEQHSMRAFDSRELNMCSATSSANQSGRVSFSSSKDSKTCLLGHDN